MKYPDVTLVLHGPFSMHTVFSLYKYRGDFKIIVVGPAFGKTPDPMVMDIINELVEEPGNDILLILYNESVLHEGYDNTQNRFYHFMSVHAALELCTTRYAVKMRNDEFYSNLTPVIVAMYKYKRKIITNNVFFRKTSYYSFHPSDHIVGGTTKTLTKMFLQARKFCEVERDALDNGIWEYIKKHNSSSHIAAEQILGMAAMVTRYPKYKLKDPDVVKMMKDTFHIVPVDLLGVYKICYSSFPSGPREFFDTGFYKEHTDVSDIRNYT